jgi:hypothetical protein
MEKFQEARDKAVKNLHVADHILNVTYPLIKDSKLLLGVMDNIFLSLTNGMAAILWHDRLFKEIPPFHDNFESKFNLFRVKSMRHHKISTQYSDLIQEIKGIIVLHRNSSVEFRKRNSFVICHDDYSVTTITAAQIKKYLDKSKTFITTMEGIVNQNERIFGRGAGRVKTC